jgi:hypothetical protein
MAKQCDEGCNDAAYVLVNGSERRALCEPALKDELYDLVTNNDDIAFSLTPATKDKLAEIEVQ